MPEIDELISKLNKRANKYIHKQGHESFYTKPYEVVSESAKHIREDFTDYFTTTVKVGGADDFLDRAWAYPSFLRYSIGLSHPRDFLMRSSR